MLSYFWNVPRIIPIGLLTSALVWSAAGANATQQGTDQFMVTGVWEQPDQGGVASGDLARHSRCWALLFIELPAADVWLHRGLSFLRQDVAPRTGFGEVRGASVPRERLTVCLA
jgi:hypothetical protein